MKRQFYLLSIILALDLFAGVLQLRADQTVVIELPYSAPDTRLNCLLPIKKYQRPRVGLALSGGGARCIPQIGVLQVLAENNIPIDCIVASSMGSVIGGLYAAGYDPQEILQHLQRIDWQNIVNDRPQREYLFLSQKEMQSRAIFQLRFAADFRPYIPSGLTPGQSILNILTDLTMLAPYGACTNFDNLAIPLRVITTDLISGREVILDHGSLADALCASLAFPLLFSPIKWDSLLLVDGGMVNNIPVEEARALGMDLIIAVDATSNLRNKDQIALPWDIVDQATTIMQRQKNQSQKQIADVYLRFEMPGQLSGDFTNLDTLVAYGREQTRQHLNQIKKLIAARDRQQFQTHDPDSVTRFHFQKIQVNGLQHLTANNLKLLRKLDSLQFQAVTRYDLRRLLVDFYETGDFQNARACIQCTADDTSLTLELEENPMPAKIIFQGNTVFPDSLLLRILEIKPGQVINTQRSCQTILKLLKLYRANGYSLAQIQAISLNPAGELTLQIHEGKIAQIKVNGNEITRDFVILREFPLVVGDIYNYNRVKHGLRSIYSTGLFNMVRQELTSDGTQPRVTLKVNEKYFYVIRFGGRYDNQRKGLSFVEMAHDNILGTGNSLTLHGQTGDRDKKILLQFQADRIFKTYLTTRFNIFRQMNKYYIYTPIKREGEYAEVRSGFNFAFGQQMARLGTVSLEGRYHQIAFKSFAGQGYPTGQVELKTLALRSTVDTRDRNPFPTKGKFYQFFYEFSSAIILISEVPYFKLFSSLENYMTFRHYHTLHPKLVWGTSDLTTPLSEQFYLGGEASFYGLQDRQRYGRHLMLAGLEYRLNLPKKLPFDIYLHLRADLAGIWEKEVDVKSKDFLVGLGSKVSVNTPLGPFSLAYGRTRDQQIFLYFSAGFDF